jgi:hypothetical protein
MSEFKESPKDADATSQQCVVLRPCPFCGSGDVILERQKGGLFSYKGLHIQVGSIVCRQCNAVGPSHNCLESGKVESVWNNRYIRDVPKDFGAVVETQRFESFDEFVEAVRDASGKAWDDLDVAFELAEIKGT